jgi:osmotically inducible lipoprotein OsmB
MKTMKQMKQIAASTFAVAVLLGLGGCAGMSERDKSTAIGAGVGAVGGAALTGGSAAGTIGGAAVGGVIGNQVGKDK